MNIGIRAFNIQIPEHFYSTENIKKMFFKDKTIVDAAFIAGKNVLESLSLDPSTIDLVLFGGFASSERLLWTPSAKLQYLLGISNAFAYDVFNGCNSLQVCLQIAYQFLTTQIEKRRVLIFIGDKLSLIGDHRNVDHKSLWSFGDAASALLVEKNCSKLTLLSQFFITDGQFFDDLWFNTKDETTYLDNNPERNEALALAYEKNYILQIHEVIKKANLLIDDIRAICMNQGSPRTIEKIEKAMNLSPEMIIKTYDQYGHLGSTDVLIGLEKILNNKFSAKTGDHVVLASSSLGSSWGCTVVKI